jgi:hypothetical protein
MTLDSTENPQLTDTFTPPSTEAKEDAFSNQEKLGIFKETASKQNLLDTANKAIDEKQRLEEVVIYGFQTGYPQFVKKLEEISSRSLRRAWAAAVMGPLLEKPPHFSYPEEREAYQMAIKLDEYKFSMILLGLDKYGPNLKGTDSAPVSSASYEAAGGRPTEGNANQAEATVPSDNRPGASGENPGTV